MRKKLLSWVLVIAMVLSMVISMPMTASAEAMPGAVFSDVDLDQVYFAEDTLTFNITGLSGLPAGTPVRLAFGITDEAPSSFTPAMVLTNLLTADGVANYAATTIAPDGTTLAGAISGTVASGLSTGVAAVKLYADVDGPGPGTWTNVIPSDGYIPLTTAGGQAAMVGLDSVIVMPLGVTSSPVLGDGAQNEEDLRAMDISFTKTIATGITGKISFTGLNLMDNSSELSDLDDGLIMDQVASPTEGALAQFTMGIDSTTIDYLASQGATVSVTSASFDGFSTDKFTAAAADAGGETVSDLNFDDETDTVSFKVNHFSNYTLSVLQNFLPTDDTWIGEYYQDWVSGSWNTIDTGITVSEGYSAYALVRFDVASLPASADRVMLQLGFSRIPSGGGHLSKVTAHQVTSSWDEETLSYSTKPTWDPTILDTFDGSVFGGGSSGDVWEWDITELYSQWKADPSTNFGVLLSAPTRSDDQYASQNFYSKEGAPNDSLAPRLVFKEDSDVEPPSATNVAITGTPVVGETLTGTYDFNGTAESGTTFRWLKNSGTQQLITQIHSIAGVSNNPLNPSIVTLSQDSFVTLIYTYHYFNYGTLPGTIALQEVGGDGTVFGPWTAVGSEGSGSPNAYWSVYPNVTIPAGQYQVMDSDKATWSWTEDTGGRGMAYVYGNPTYGDAYTPIEGATAKTYTLTAADAGCMIKFEVTPQDLSGVSGSAVLSAAVGPVELQLIKSSDASLMGLTATGITFTPEFSSSMYNYTASVANNISSTTVAATANDSSATVKINGTEAISQVVALKVGSNTITVEVAAEDGVTTKTYIITINRAAASGSSGGGSVVLPQPVNTQRLGGIDRFATSVVIAESLYSGPIRNCILATGLNFPDALSGSSLANKLKAPVLLCGNSPQDSQSVLNYIKSHLTPDGTLYVLGGLGAVPQDILDALKDIGVNNIQVLSGQDRYLTNLEILKKLNFQKGTPIFITTGEDFPDSLSISSVAASKGYPVLLCGKDSIGKASEDYLKNLAPSQIYIIGGTGAVSDALSLRLQQTTGLSDGSMIRIQGQNRYLTALNIAKYFKLDSSKVLMATGTDFPDALTGTTLAAHNNSSILLAGGEEQMLKEYLDSQKYTDAIICGGTGAIPESIIDALFK